MPELIARHYRTGRLYRLLWPGPAGAVPGQAAVRLEPAAAVPGSPAPPAPRRRPAGPDRPLLAPALCDLQVNGYGGLDFSVPDNLGRIAAQLAARGVSRLCPTVITGSEQAMSRALAGPRSGSTSSGCRPPPAAASAS
jgi:hypothetical protein